MSKTTSTSDINLAFLMVKCWFISRLPSPRTAIFAPPWQQADANSSRESLRASSSSSSPPTSILNANLKESLPITVWFHTCLIFFVQYVIIKIPSELRLTWKLTFTLKKSELDFLVCCLQRVGKSLITGWFSFSQRNRIQHGTQMEKRLVYSLYFGFPQVSPKAFFILTRRWR